MKKEQKEILIGIDTGFFFALQYGNEKAVEVWKNSHLAVSVLVLYELQKQLLKRESKKWKWLVEEIKKATLVVKIVEDIAQKAAHISHGTGIPALDALILASLLHVGCKTIYTTDKHLEMYAKKGIKIVNLRRTSGELRGNTTPVT